MEPNKLYFWAAAGWTGVIALLCLVSFNQLPSVGITVEDADKFVHAAFHFGFTILWFMYFRMRYPQIMSAKILTGTLVFSIAYGILIEVAQEFLTTTRQADMKDVLANLTGSVLGVLTLIGYSSLMQKK